MLKVCTIHNSLKNTCFERCQRLIGIAVKIALARFETHFVRTASVQKPSNTFRQDVDKVVSTVISVCSLFIAHFFNNDIYL